MCKANTYHTPCAPAQPTSSKLVAVNEAADTCLLYSLQLPSGHLTQPRQPHTRTTCTVAGQGETQANIGGICDNGAMKTLVLSGTYSFTFLLGYVASHSHLFNCNCYYDRKHCIVWRWDLHRVYVTSWVIDRNPWSGVYTIGKEHSNELKCLVSAKKKYKDLPYWFHYSRPFFLHVGVADDY